MRLAAVSTKSILILTALAVLVAGQVVPSPVPAAAAEVPRAFSPFGMNSHPMWSWYTRADIDAELDAMAAAGARWIRFDIGWNYLELARGSYNEPPFRNLDYIVAAAKQHGIEPQVTVMATPGWANGGAGIWVPPSNDSDFANFMRYVASRYRGRIRYWEIWNEPNLDYYWKPTPDAARYTRLLRAAYEAVKAGNPDAVVISGGLAGNDQAYLNEMYEAGARGYFDLLGMHPYTGNHSPYDSNSYENYKYDFSTLAKMRGIMEANGDADKHMWISEMGWSTANAEVGVSEAQQAQYVAEAYKRVFEEFPYVDAMIIYNLRNKGTNAASVEENYGLTRKDFSWKPAYQAFAQAAETWWPSATLTVSPATVTYGQSNSLSIHLAPAGASPVAIQRMVVGTSQWEDVTSTATTADGTAMVSLTPTATTSYRAILQDRGLTTNVVTVRVRARVTMSASRRIVRRLRAVRMSGRVLLPAPGTTVIVQRKTGRRWINVRRAITNSVGRFVLKLRHRRSGRYYYRARFPGNPSHLGTYGRPVRLTVR